MRRVANAIIVKMREGGHPVPLEFWGNRRLLLGLAALIHKGRLYEAPAIAIATKAAKAENPFKYLWKSCKSLFWNEWGADLNHELAGFKIPEKL